MRIAIYIKKKILWKETKNFQNHNTMATTHDHIQWASNTQLAKRVEELARRHVDEDLETLLVAARRLRAFDNQTIPFNHEAVE